MNNQENIIKLWADFNNSSEVGLRLNCNGTIEDLARQKVELKEGMRLLIWDEDLDENNNQDNIIVEAIAKYNQKDKIWEAVFESEKVRHESDLKNNPGN